MDQCRLLFSRRSLKLFCLGLASLLSLRSISQEISIQQHSALKVDGGFEDWKGLDGFSYPSSQDIWQENGTFGPDDLTVELKLGTNEYGIVFFIQWSDDIIDSKFYPKGFLHFTNGFRGTNGQNVPL